MVPLQEHQRSAPVLTQQLLFALLQGQFGLSDLLALHRASALSNGLHHVVNTGGLSPAHTLCRTPEDIARKKNKGVNMLLRCYYVSGTVELTGVSCRCCRGSVGSSMVYLRYGVSPLTGNSNLPPFFSSSIKIGWVLAGSSISPHMLVT